MALSTTLRNICIKCLLWGICCGTEAAAQSIWINEFQYGAANNAIEVALPIGASTSDIEIILYDGRNGKSYAKHPLSTFQPGVAVGSYVLYHKAVATVQSELPSGVALMQNAGVAHFISYGGSFYAIDDAAAGLSSDNINLPSGLPSGQSFQRSGTPNAPIWVIASATPGAVNAGQTLPAPMLSATLRDAAMQQPAKPGDTITYTFTLRNAGTGDATAMNLNRSGDPNTSFVPGSFKSTPVALPKAVLSVLEGTATTITLQGLDPDGDQLAFSILQLPQHGTLSDMVSLSNTTTTVRYDPQSGFSGLDHFTFVVQDDDNNRDTASVNIQILPVNQPPSFSPGTDVTLLEDAGSIIIENWATNISAGPPNEQWQALEFSILENSNLGLFEQVPSLAADGTLQFSAKADSNGMAQLIIQLSDNGSTTNGGVDTSMRYALIINVLPVNDAPSFMPGNDIQIPYDDMPQVFENWATNILAGPPDEALQVLQFLVEVAENEALFAEAPSIDSSGTLRFRLAETASGNARISVQLKDDGGTDNGGVDASEVMQFQIIIKEAENE